ncbi:MAG: hypothetical protein JW839_16625 [Candidatus Lokiarchaeota archaeon]|nr:hypothetical protein [Candidatus Lokiarchaeota archaeon]
MVTSAKRLFLALLASTCLASLVLIPAVQGYGGSQSTAEEISNGIVNESMPAEEWYVWYKIYCNSGDSMSIALIHFASADLNVIFYDPSGSQVAASTNFEADEHISYRCMRSGYHYIMVERMSGGGTTIYMSVAGATERPAAVPGFDAALVLMAVPLAGAIGALLLVKRGKAAAV